MTTPEPLRLPEQAMPIARTIAGQATPRPDVPDELIQIMADAEFDAPPGCSARDSYRTVLAAVVPVIERRVIAKLFGTPEEIAAREAEAAKCKPDDVTEICERAAPGRHERQVRERVAAESAVLDPADLAELLNYVIGREGIRVVQEETLDRAFAALKATQRGES